MTNLLITDCLQQDFVGLLDSFAGLPNRLHVGHSESRRLLGAIPAEGPVARTLAWAHRQADAQLRVIHVRDWHDPERAEQREHLARFGAHCLQNTAGASFVFSTDDIPAHKQVEIVDATTLSNFLDTRLPIVLNASVQSDSRIGLMGVWTEAKISFLAYDLRTRYPNAAIAVCPALTASSSREHHFQALEQMARLLGVQIVDSVGEFIAFLGGELQEAPLLGFDERCPELCSADQSTLDEEESALLRYLFRGRRSLRYRSLGGGFSGSRVLATESVDLHGHQEVPHVVKIDLRAKVGQERSAFERVEAVLGNSAPRITDFADYGGLGALKYRYASMGRGRTRPLKSLYQNGASDEQIKTVLDQVFVDQLGRLYRAGQAEHIDLHEYYGFRPQHAESTAKQLIAVLGCQSGFDELHFAGGRRVRSVANYYRDVLPNIDIPRRAHVLAFIHGDLNGANVLVDEPGNVWMIDFFHTHRGHVLKDLAKMENDLLYIWTPLAEQDLDAACRFSEAMIALSDLGRPPPMQAPVELPENLQRAWRGMAQLRSYYPPLIGADRDVSQLLIAQIRYAVHTLFFEESNAAHKHWAAYSACLAAERLAHLLNHNQRLRIDWLPMPDAAPGRVGLTLLPGRRDFDRNLNEDLAVIAAEGIDQVLCLVPVDELEHYGVADLLNVYRESGLGLRHLPIADGSVPTAEQALDAVQWIESARQSGQSTLIHCVGGLGRAGTLAAAWLIRQRFSADQAIRQVRTTRSPRAIETAAQEAFLAGFAGLPRS